MDMDYPSNSQKKEQPEKAKTPEKTEHTVERVTTGKVVQKKKPLGKRFRETFIQGGGFKSVMSEVFWQVMIPAGKDLVVDAGKEALDRTFYGSSSPGRRRAGLIANTALGHVAYHQAATRKVDPRSREVAGPSKRARASHDFSEIYLATRVEANEVIDNLFNLIERFEVATVADLYDMCDISSDWPDRKFGWTNLQGADVVHTRNGYLLDLPKPEHLE